MSRPVSMLLLLVMTATLLVARPAPSHAFGVLPAEAIMTVAPKAGGAVISGAAGVGLGTIAAGVVIGVGVGLAIGWAVTGESPWGWLDGDPDDASIPQGWSHTVTDPGDCTYQFRTFCVDSVDINESAGTVSFTLWRSNTLSQSLYSKRASDGTNCQYFAILSAGTGLITRTSTLNPCGEDWYVTTQATRSWAGCGGSCNYTDRWRVDVQYNEVAQPDTRSRRISVEAECIDGSGTITTVQTVSPDYVVGDPIPPIPAASCPDGNRIHSYRAVRQGTDMADEVLATYDAPAIWSDPTWEHFPCMDPGAEPCEVMVFQVQADGSLQTCNTDGTPCAGWATRADRAERYQCWWGGQQLALNQCAAYVPSFEPGSLGQVDDVTVAEPQLPLTDPPGPWVTTVVDTWDVQGTSADVGVTLDSSGVSRNGGPCATQACTWAIEGVALGEHGEFERATTLATGTLPAGQETITRRAGTIDPADALQVTHVRSTITSDDGTVTLASAPVLVGEPEAPFVDLAVSRWQVTPSVIGLGGQVELDIDLSAAWLAAPGGPCASSSCGWNVEAGRQLLPGVEPGTLDTLGQGPFDAGTWGAARNVTATRSLEQVTHVRGIVESSDGSTAATSAWLPVVLSTSEADVWADAYMPVVWPLAAEDGLDAVCAALQAAPAELLSYTRGGSDSDQFQACADAVAAGGTLTDAIRATVATGPPLLAGGLVGLWVGTTMDGRELQTVTLPDGATQVLWPPAPVNEEPPPPEPEPDPAAAGAAGMKPPNDPGCLDDTGKTALRDSLKVQTHHLATNKNKVRSPRFTQQFQRVLDQHGLGHLRLSNAWNKVRIPHRGPHPLGYNQWVLDNFRTAASWADSRANELWPNEPEATKTRLRETLFVRAFAYVEHVVNNDPTIVTKAWWDC